MKLNNVYRNLGILPIFILFIVFPSKGQNALTLEQAIKTALLHNHSILISQNANEISENNATYGNADLLPTVGVNAGYNYSNSEANLTFAGELPPQNGVEAESQSYNASIGINYVLFDGLGNIRTFQKYGKQKDLSTVQTKIAIESTMLQVINAFYELVREEQQLKLQQQTLVLSKERYKRNTLNYEYGGGSKIDLLNAQVDYYRDSSNVLSSKQNVENAVNNLNFLMGQPIENTFNADENSFSTIPFSDYEQLKKEASENNTNLMLSLVNLELSELDVQMTKSYFYPKISMNASYGYSRSDNTAGILLKNETLGFSGGVSLAWNLFNGNKRNIALQNAKILLENNDLKKQEALLSIHKELKTMYGTHQNNIMIIDLEKENVSIAQINLDRSKELLENGQISNIDFRQAQLNLLVSQTRLNNAQYAAKITEFQLKRLKGDLLSEQN